MKRPEPVPADSEPAMSPQRAMMVLRSAVTIGDMRRIAEGIARRAIEEVQNPDASPSWAHLVVDRVIGRVRVAPLMLSKLDLGDLTTVEGCQEATQRLVRLLAEGSLCVDEAEDARKTIALALQALRTGQTARIEEHLENGGAIVFYGAADKDPEAVGKDLADTLKAQRAALEN